MQRLLCIIIISLNVFSVSGQRTWTAIMSQSTMGQTYNSFYEFSSVEKFIRDKAKDGKVVSELEYGIGKWYVVATQRSGTVNITWTKEKDFPKSWVKEKWDDGKYITKVAWGDNSWVVIMTDATNFTQQKWAVRDSWADLEKWVAEAWRENTSYTITELAYANGKWCGVMSILNSYEPQSYKVSKEFPSKWIQSKYDEKYNISVVENDGLNWYVVMNKKYSQLSETILNPEAAFPQAKIKEQWDKDRRITGLVYTGKTADYEDDPDEADLFASFLESQYDEFAELKKSGSAKLTAKNYIGAITDFEKASKIDDSDEEVWNNLAWARFLGGYCYTALSDADKSLAIKSNAYNNHTKAMILKCQGKCSESIPYFNEAIRLVRAENGKVTNVDYYADRADAKKCMKNYSGALDDIELALTIEPSNSTLKKKQKELNDLL